MENREYIQKPREESVSRRKNNNLSRAQELI
jgi:hypothetical protein